MMFQPKPLSTEWRVVRIFADTEDPDRLMSEGNEDGYNLHIIIPMDTDAGFFALFVKYTYPEVSNEEMPNYQWKPDPSSGYTVS
jgi:hypothetical protein